MIVKHFNSYNLLFVTKFKLRKIEKKLRKEK